MLFLVVVGLLIVLNLTKGIFILWIVLRLRRNAGSIEWAPEKAIYHHAQPSFWFEWWRKKKMKWYSYIFPFFRSRINVKFFLIFNSKRSRSDDYILLVRIFKKSSKFKFWKERIWSQLWPSHCGPRIGERGLFVSDKNGGFEPWTFDLSSTCTWYKYLITSRCNQG